MISGWIPRGSGLGFMYFKWSWNPSAQFWVVFEKSSILGFNLESLQHLSKWNGVDPRIRTAKLHQKASTQSEIGQNVFRTTSDRNASITNLIPISVHAFQRWSSMSTFLMTNHPKTLKLGWESSKTQLKWSEMLSYAKFTSRWCLNCSNAARNQYFIRSAQAILGSTAFQSQRFPMQCQP